MMYEGITLSVWNLPSDPDILVENARTCGAKTVDFKVHDGDSLWTAKRFVTPEYVKALKSAGLFVSGWGYGYLDSKDASQHVGGGGVPELEAAAAVGGVFGLKLDAYSSDVEESGDLVGAGAYERFYRSVRDGDTATLSGDSSLGPRGYKVDALGAYVWVNPNGHWDSATLAAILKYVDVLRPMCYGEANSLNVFFDNWGPILNGKKVAPVFSITDSNPDDYLAEQVDWAIRQNCIGYGIWERSAVSSRPTAVQAMQRAWMGVAKPSTPPSSNATLDELRATIFDSAGSLVNLGNSAEGTAIQEIIRLAKGEK